LCTFFKQGLCKKGDRCKFSHDLAIERKTEKRNVYFDNREDEQNGSLIDDYFIIMINLLDNVDDWSEEKLNEVVEQKHGEKDKNKPRTEIVCFAKHVSIVSYFVDLQILSRRTRK
jgi:hypothetical protein